MFRWGLTPGSDPVAILGRSRSGNPAKFAVAAGSGLPNGKPCAALELSWHISRRPNRHTMANSINSTDHDNWRRRAEAPWGQTPGSDPARDQGKVKAVKT